MSPLLSYIRSRRYSLLLLLLLAVIVYYFSATVYWILDNIAYKYIYTLENGECTLREQVRSFADLIRSQNTHYLIMNGRYLVHVCVQSFCALLGQKAFALCNALMYIALICLTVKVSGSNLRSFRATLSASTLIFLCLGTNMDPACQINYIWVYVLCLSFINYFLSVTAKYKWWQLVLLGILSLAAGQSHEGIVVGLALALIANVLVHRFQLNRKHWVMTICFGIGAMILCFSPGAIHRSEGTTIMSMPVFLTCLLINTHAGYLLWGVTSYKLIKHKIRWVETYKGNMLLWNSYFGCLLFVVLLRFLEPRVLFGVEILAILLLLRILKHHSLTGVFQIIFGGIVLIFLGFQVHRVQYTSEKFKTLESLYASTDGPVFIDFDLEPSYTAHYGYAGSAMYLYSNQAWSSEILERYYQYKYGVERPLVVLPEALRGHLADSLLTPGWQQVSDRVFMVVEDKERNGEYMVRRGFNIFGHRFHERVRYPSFNSVVWETEHYRVRILTNIVPLVSVSEPVWIENQDISASADN